MNKLIQWLTAAAGATFGFLWGQMDGLLYALIAFMVFDYITGVLVAIAQKELSSKVGFKGIAKKCCILILVAVGHLFDEHVLGGGAVTRMAVAGFYLANEGLSILENAAELDIPLPKKLINLLHQLQELDEEDEKEESENAEN